MMVRFAVIVFLLARAAGAQTLSDPLPLTAATRIPSFRDTGRVVAARARDGFVVVWEEEALFRAVLRMKRMSSQREVTGEGALEADLAPLCAASSGDETLVSVITHDSRSNYVRIRPDGRMTVLPMDTPPYGVTQLVPFGDGYLGTRNPFGERAEIVRLDLDGRVVARVATAMRNLPVLVTAGDKTLLLAVDGNALHASTIGPDLGITNDVILAGDLALNAQISATADRPGELAVATNTFAGLAVLFFDSNLRDIGRVALPPPPSYVTGPVIASTGDGYAVAIPSGNVILVTIDAQRRLATTSVPSLGLPPPLVTGTHGALLAVISPGSPPRVNYVMAGGNEPALPPRLLADAEPDQRWPRIARIGGRVAIAWDESTGVNTALMAAVFDPSERRIVAGPVEVARDAADQFGGELAVASDGNNIAIAWTAQTSHLLLLSPRLQTLVSTTYGERIHDVVWNGSAYVVAEGTSRLGVERWDATLHRIGTYDLQQNAVSDGYNDGRLSVGTSDVLLLTHDWYHLLCYCGEGPWHVTVDRLSPFDWFGWPRMLATANLYDVKQKMSGFARTGDQLLLFFPQKTEVRSAATLALLKTIPNPALTQELPFGSIGQAAVAGNVIVGAFGSVIEWFELDGTPVDTLPLDESANDSQFAAGTPIVIVDDAVASSGSRRINVRLLDFALPHRRAAAH